MAKFTGKGGEFQVRTVASPETFVAVGQVREIGSATITSEEIDVTTLDDNVSGTPTDYKDFLPGFKDPGEISLTVLFDPSLATHGSLANGLFGLFSSGASFIARIKIPSSPVYYIRVNGFFRDFNTPTINATDPIEAVFVFRLRQQPTLGTT